MTLGKKNDDYLSSHAQYMDKKRRDERDIKLSYPFPIKDPSRRAACKQNLERFLTTYMPETFHKPFSQDHKKIIAAFQDSILNDRNQAVVADRGKGKSSIARGAAIWAISYGHRRCYVLVGATQRQASQHLGNTKREFQRNPLLAEDFPELCRPIIALQNSARRCDSQTVNGELTWIKWTQDFIRLPIIPDSEGGGGILAAFPITGAIMGFNVDGVRPDIVHFDDIETRETVKSEMQTQERRKIMSEDCAGLGEQGGRFSMLFIGTIRSRGCIADEITDRELNPAWNGLRFRFLVEPPKRQDLWDQYLQVFATEGPDAAHKLYVDRRSDMDTGAKVSWEESYNPQKHSSALEYFYFQWGTYGSDFVQCELQNDPRDPYEGMRPLLKPRDILVKMENLKPKLAPAGYTILTGFIDIHDDALYFMVMAFQGGFNCATINYGRVPVVSDGGNVEPAIRAALIHTIDGLFSTVWTDEQGAPLGLSRVLVDSGYKTKLVYEVTRRHRSGLDLLPSKGEAHSAHRAPDIKCPWGDGWWYAPTREKDAMLFHINADLWKTYLDSAIRVPVGGRGAWIVYHGTHRELAEHLTSEKYEPESAKDGQKYDKWSLKQQHVPNHWLDCAVGCMAAASSLGVRHAGVLTARKKRKKKRPPGRGGFLRRTGY